ncbi:phage tail spike protein [Anaerococcus degeneri]|uniref:Phage tail protein n=1 Tax=Anaerococcus degeneri TaxID=361500 RepID=A0ABS7YV05_9FIRM|nr:phage tail spike protein [Anaerococcus degeneri]MBP2015808.1 phage minor structural protein [Anaerococcus degeneri]MCA2095560.1 phage tail protein [Anaerococcus degeneri]
MYKIVMDGNTIYYPGDEKAVLISSTLNLELNTAGTLSFICPPENPYYEKIYNRKSIVSVYRDEREIFIGEVREQTKDLRGNKKVQCVGLLSYLADSIQPQREYHDQTPYQLLSKFLEIHNEKVDERKRIKLGRVTITDPNDSLYRYTNYETTLEVIMTKMVEKLGGYLKLRREGSHLILDYLRLEEMGKDTGQNIEFGLNLLDYTEDLSAEDVSTAIIPLGKEIEGDVNAVLKQYTDITSVNDGKNYLVSKEALAEFGWVCKVVRWDDVTVPANLIRKGTEWLKDNQFEMVELNLSAVDLSEFGIFTETIECGDRVRCRAYPFGMDRIFPVMKQTIPLQKPGEIKVVLGSNQSKGYIQSSQDAVRQIKEEGLVTRKIDNERVQSAIDNLKAQMNTGTGGYKLTEYDSSGRWLRDLYMDTPDKDTATKVLQINMNGIGGSRNGYKGPYAVGMTLDGMIYGERIMSHSIDAEKLSVSYTSQVERQILDSKKEAISDTDKKLKNYYTISEVNTRLSATDKKIEASVETINQKLEQKNGNYYGTYVPNYSRAPTNSWNSDRLRLTHVGDFFYDTTTGYAYRYIMKKQGLELKFNASSRTESERYDWVEIFYELDGKTYALPRCGGTSIAGQTVFIPSDKFWLYWRSDGSGHDYYGFKIDSIKKASSSQEVIGSESKLPTDAGDAVLLSGSSYPESEHSPYKDGTRKLWKYSSTESISSSLSFDWIRVVDKDISAAKEKAETAISKISVVEGSISSMVKKGEFGTFMRQNYNSFLLGFNGASRYVQITAGEIGLYNGSIDSSNKRAVFDENGNHFYRDGKYIGKIGTNVWSGNSSHKGLVFDLDSEGKYMAFSQEESANAGSYTTMLCFSRSNSIYSQYGIHLGCNLYAHGFKIVDPQWETGFGVNATINFVQILGMNSDGTVSRWGSSGRMVFKDGVLMDLNYYG